MCATFGVLPATVLLVEQDRLAAEQRARVLIDRQLTEAGWSVQSRKDLNLYAGQGVAVREAVMASGHGRSDYLLDIDQRAVGVIEAKPEGMPLSGVEWQSAMYADGLPAPGEAQAAHRRPHRQGELVGDGCRHQG